MSDDVVFSKAPDLSNKVFYSANGISEMDIKRSDIQISNQYKVSYLESSGKDIEDLHNLYKKMAEGDISAHEDMFQLTHKMRGQGSTFNYLMMTKLADKLCVFIEKNQQITAKELVIIKLYIDTIHVTYAKRMEGDGGNIGKELLLGLDSVAQKIMKSA